MSNNCRDVITTAIDNSCNLGPFGKSNCEYRNIGKLYLLNNLNIVLNLVRAKMKKKIITDL